MASATPVIITDRVNIWREIAQRRAGLVVEDTLEGVAAGIAHWCEAMDPAEITAMRERALACYCHEFRIEGAARKLVEVIAAAAPNAHRMPIVSSAGSTTA
jgi:glycosyltransferase involved in cell wall biosynthesis